MNRIAVLSLLPLFSLVAQPSGVGNYKALHYPKLKEVTVPVPMTFTLANGMRVLLLEDHDLPLVSGSALVRTGNLFDPPDKRGLADLTGSLIRTGGTKTKSADQLDEELENIAAAVESSIGESSGGVSFSCLKENVDEVMGVFRDVLTAPDFRKDKVELAKTQARSGISRRNDDASGVASREFSSTIYGRDTPWGWTIEYEHIDRIHRADMVAFHKRYFFPRNVILSVYGDFSSAEMKAKLEKVFGAWDVTQEPVPPFPPLKQKPQPGIWLAERDDVTQTFFEIGHLGGLLNDKEYPALQVAANILGNGFSSRLVGTVRTKLGYAYSISAGWGAGYASPGVFEISGSTKSSTTTETIRVVDEEVQKMRSGEVSEEELRIAKDAVLNSFVFSFDRPSKTLNRMVTYEYFGYPKDFIFQYQKAVAAVTRADVLRVAKERFRPDNFTIVAVGNPKEFGKPLADLKIPVHKLDLTIPPPKEAESTDKGDGAAILKRVQDAMGGRAKLAAVRDLETTVDVKFQMGASMAPGKQKMMRIFPDVLRQEQELPFGRILVFSDGKSGWIKSPQGLSGLPMAVAQQVRQEMFRNILSLALSDGVSGRKIRGLGDGKTVEIEDPQGDRATLELDQDTGLPKTVRYKTTPLAGTPAEVVETYSAWKDVNGVMLPFEYTIDQNRNRFAEARVTGYRVNAGLTVEELSKKP